MLDVLQDMSDPRFGQQRLDTVEVVHTFVDYGVWALLTPLIFWLSRRFSLDRERWGWHLLLHLVLAVGLAGIVDLVSHVTYNVLGGPHGPRPVSLLYVFSDFHFLPEFSVYLVVLTAGFGRDYFLRYQERQREAIELRAQAAELQLQAVELQGRLAEAHLQTLRMQLNPHFLFNTLNAISAYVEREPRTVRRMIARLSELLRYTLDGTEKPEVPLRQELAFSDSYLEIQCIRFRNRLEVHREIDPDVLDALVPNLILQPIIENAVKHGVSKLEGVGRVELAAWREGERLVLAVRDNGPGPSAPSSGEEGTSSHGIGLRITRERLESLYGGAQDFALEPAPEGGAVARISLPYRTAALAARSES